MWVVYLILLIPIIYTCYYRYVPVRGVKCIQYHKLDCVKVKVDLRDYNDSAKETIDQAIALPVAYIKRFHHELPKEPLNVIASNVVERNIGIRLLKRYGYEVAGYLLIDKRCCCKNQLTNFA